MTKPATRVGQCWATPLSRTKQCSRALVRQIRRPRCRALPARPTRTNSRVSRPRRDDAPGHSGARWCAAAGAPPPRAVPRAVFRVCASSRPRRSGAGPGGAGRRYSGTATPGGMAVPLSLMSAPARLLRGVPLDPVRPPLTSARCRHRWAGRRAWVCFAARGASVRGQVDGLAALAQCYCGVWGSSRHRHAGPKAGACGGGGGEGGGRAGA
jgi:hypothetical protein